MAAISSTDRGDKIFKENFVRSFNNPSVNFATGILEEARVFKLLEQSQVVRSWDFGRNDGAIYCGSHTLRHMNYADKFSWYYKHRKSSQLAFIPFDVKAIGFRLYRDEQRLPFNPNTQTQLSFGTPKITDFQRQSAQFIIITITHCPEFLALVPTKALPANYIDALEGHLQWYAQVSPYLAPFILRSSHLQQAILRVIRACHEADYWYTVPGSEVVIRGWKPRYSDDPGLLPAAASQNGNSLQSILEFQSAIQNHNQDFYFDFNPVQPLLGDFVLISKHQTLMFEHKVGLIKFRGAEVELYYPATTDSPISPRRRWDFFFTQTRGHRDCDIAFCIPRSDVKPEWQASATSSPLTHTFSYNKLVIPRSQLQPYELLLKGKWVDEMIEKIVRPYCAQDCALEITDPQNSSLSATRASALAEEHRASNQESIESPMPVALSERRETSHYSWIVQDLLSQCALRKRGLVLPLDAGHPIGQFVMLNWTWTNKQRASFFQDEIPPVHLNCLSPQTICIVFRIVDLSNRGDSWEPFLARARDFRSSRTRQPHLLVGDPIGRGARELENPPPMLILPSGLLRQTFHSDSRSVEYEHDGSGYQWREQAQMDQALDRDDFPLQSIVEGVNLLHYQVHYEALYKTLIQFLDGEIESSCIGYTTQPCDHAPYWVTVQRIMQSAWDFGVQRQIPLQAPDLPSHKC